jgi:hypothetical protein
MTILAADFFHAGTVLLRRLYVFSSSSTAPAVCTFSVRSGQVLAASRTESGSPSADVAQTVQPDFQWPLTPASNQNVFTTM